jgi:hypothetical protein
VLPIRLDSRYAEGYVADVVVPSPEALMDGYALEVRAVEDDGSAYTMQVLLKGDDIAFEEVAHSAYRLTKNDPWYFAGSADDHPEDARLVSNERGDYVRPSSAYRGVTRQIWSEQEMRDRLLDNLNDLASSQQHLRDVMRDQEMAGDRARAHERQLAETQKRIDETHAQLNRNSDRLRDLHQQRGEVGESMFSGLLSQANESSLLQRLNEQHRGMTDFHREAFQREQTNQADRDRERDERQRERDARARDEQQGRGANPLRPDVWTVAPTSDPSRVTIGGEGAKIFGDPHNVQ